jgi:hypothetical protein
MKPRRALLFSITVVLTLFAACGVWLHREQQQYARNRALIHALTHNDTKTALTLVNAGADPNTRQFQPPAPTLPQLLQQLLHHVPPSADANPTAFLMACGGFDRNLPPPVTSVILHEDVPLVQAMLDHGANVHASDNDKRTALHGAAGANHRRTAELLLTHGANVNAQDAKGHTPLLEASATANAAIAHLLLSHGANPNVQALDGYTALHYAQFFSNAQVLNSDFLAHGADFSIRAGDGVTPLQLAQKYGHAELIQMLKRGGK